MWESKLVDRVNVFDVVVTVCFLVHIDSADCERVGFLYVIWSDHGISLLSFIFVCRTAVMKQLHITVMCSLHICMQIVFWIQFYRYVLYWSNTITIYVFFFLKKSNRTIPFSWQNIIKKCANASAKFPIIVRWWNRFWTTYGARINLHTNTQLITITYCTAHWSSP